MKVLQYSTWNERCGIAAYTKNLVHGLTDLGVEVEVHPVNTRARKYAVRLEVQRDLDACASRAADFDLVHIQHEFSFFDRFDLRQSIRQFARLLSRVQGRRKPVVVTFHTQPPFRHALVELIDQRRGGLSRQTRALLAVRNLMLARQWRRTVGRRFQDRRRCQALVHTKTTRRVLVEEAKFGERQVTVVPMGVVRRNPALNGLDPVAAKRQLGYPPDTRLLSIFGFVQQLKGYEVALRALSELPACYQLAIVGGPHPEGGTDRTLDHVLETSAKLEIDHRVRVTGFVDFDTLDLYHHASDICLAPYHRGELLSGSAAMTWALSSGRPVIASSTPAFVELQEEAECLLLFTEGASHELAWQIGRLSADPALAQHLVERAAAHVNTHDWPCIARQVLTIYEDLIRA